MKQSVLVLVWIWQISLSIAAYGGEAKWRASIDDALAEAKQSGKDVLVVFDLQRSEDQSHGQRRFRNFTDDDVPLNDISQAFVLVRIFVPRDRSPCADANDERWRTKLLPKFAGLPWTILLDSRSRPYSSLMGYLTSKDDDAHWKYLRQQIRIRETRDQHFASAAESTGRQRAEHLDRGLEAMSDQLVLQHYEDEVAAILAADPDNAAGLQHKYLAKQRYAQLDSLLAEGQIGEIADRADAAIAEFSLSGSLAQDFYALKAKALLRKRDTQRGIEALSRAIDAAPDSARAPAIRGLLKKISDERVK